MWQNKEFFAMSGYNGSSLNPLDRETTRKKRVTFQRGLSPADPQKSIDRSYNAAIQRRAELIAAGIIDPAHPKFGDSTRPSFQKAVISDGLIEVYVGLTHYDAFQKDLERRTKPEDNLALQHRGAKEYSDRWAYLQQAIGTSALLIFDDGTIPVVIRETTRREYNGYVDAVSGYVLFNSQKDVANPETINLEDNLNRLIEREFGITPDKLGKKTLVGAYGHPNTGEFDFAHLVRVKLDANHFNTDKAYADQKEGKLILLRGYDDVQKVLNGELFADKGKMYGLWGEMSSLEKNDFK